MRLRLLEKPESVSQFGALSPLQTKSPGKKRGGFYRERADLSPGIRAFGILPKRVDYAAETILQRGSYSTDEVRAYAYSGVLGWTVADVKWKPRVSVEYNFASGNRNAKDGTRNTFDQFYPSNHGYTG